MTGKSLILILALALLGLLAGGCKTTKPEEESDMPWNTPQSWEGAPMIPGLNNQ